MVGMTQLLEQNLTTSWPIEYNILVHLVSPCFIQIENGI